MTEHPRSQPFSLTTTCASILACGLVMTPAAGQTGQPRPQNKVVIMVDASGSYRARRAEAIDRAAALLEQVATSKVRRWEVADAIAVVSLDAMPEVIWQGTLRDLKAEGAEQWRRRFAGRTDYAQCTDVGRAFQVALDFLEGEPGYTTKYLFAFSDLLDEPPTKSLRKCRKSVALPPTLAWEAMQDVQVHALWIPADQKLVWKRAAEEHGLSDFHLYTTSESAGVNIVPPPRAKVTEAVRQSNRQENSERFENVKQSFGTYLFSGLTWLGGTLGVLLLAGLVAGLLRRRARRAA